MPHSFINSCRARVDKTLSVWLDSQAIVAEQLGCAMRYSVFNGGKRIRPALIYASAECISGHNNGSAVMDAAAAAVECIHAYSLIHDDLPAMDNDALRRGKPTCHIEFDEATAILAGDALQTLAFQQLAELPIQNASQTVKLMRILAEASGQHGMVSGQMLDILAEKKYDIALPELENIHRLKTGALIKASILMGAESAMASASEMVQLRIFADAIGLAFQVQDDILDVTSDTVTLGKKQGADAALGKSTYVSLLGLSLAEEKLVDLKKQAYDALREFGEKSIHLQRIADFIVNRNA